MTWTVTLVLCAGLVFGAYRETSGQEVIDAAWKDDAQTVKILLTRGADPNVCRGRKDNFRSEWFCRLGARPGKAEHLGWTPLMIAALRPNDNPEMVTVLLKHGARVNAVGWMSVTALSHAVEAGNVRIAKTLLGHGADVNQTGAHGHAPLMIAAGALPGTRLVHTQQASGQSRSLGMVQLLLDAGAEVNRRNHRGQTALMFAVAQGSKDTVAALLSRGANVDVQDRYGRTAHDYAEGLPDRSVVKLLR